MTLRRILFLMLPFLSLNAGFAQTKGPAVLVFSKTAGFRHASIPAGIKAIQKLGAENGFRVMATEDAAVFTPDKLKKYGAVIFLNTTGDILNEAQQAAFEDFVKSGGGFVGVHSAADTEYEWAWYNDLVGAYFESHPAQQESEISVLNHDHPATKMLPDGNWRRFDEWYNYKALKPHIKPLLMLDETTYKGGKNGAFHPISWYHERLGGRAFYTGGGHTDASYEDPLFVGHLLGGILWALKKTD